jgi:hypothetical protein
MMNALHGSDRKNGPGDRTEGIARPYELNIEEVIYVREGFEYQRIGISMPGSVAIF